MLWCQHELLHCIHQIDESCHLWSRDTHCRHNSVSTFQHPVERQQVVVRSEQFTDIVDQRLTKKSIDSRSKLIIIPSILHQTFSILLSSVRAVRCYVCPCLEKQRVKIALLDKAAFPRDKVCGDAIGGRVKRVLEQIDPQLLSDWENFQKNVSRGWKLVALNGKEASVYFSNYGYVATRMHFDEYLFRKASQVDGIKILEGDGVKSIQCQKDGVEVFTTSGKNFKSKMIVGCDGAHSVVAKQLAGFKVNLKEYSGAVRAYYENISGIEDPNLIEIYLLKNYLPGYFWIFPLSATSGKRGFWNVVWRYSKRKIDLWKKLCPTLSNQVRC